jgi:hypothetical protein
MKSTKQSMMALLAAMALMTVSSAVRADVSVLTPVTPRAEEALTWCGAATGEMVVGAYPSGSCSPVQADVWDAIQTNKVEPSWDTDPAGLKEAMMTLCPPPGGGHWVVFSNTNASTLMYSVAFWMRRNSFPVAAVLNTDAHNAIGAHQEQWVAIKGIVTDVDPLTSSSVTLKYIFIVQQAPVFGDPAVERFITGSQWYSEFEAVTKAASTYNGKFVAVIEPPPSTGTLKAKLRLVTGTILSAQRILPLLQRSLRNSEVARLELFRDLVRLQPQTPVLVNPERGAYYIVPFGTPGKPATMAALVNAYDGELLEVARLRPRPVPSEREAIQRALRLVGRDKSKEPPAAKATLVYEGGLPYYPSWRVNVDREEVLVDVAGNARRRTSPRKAN